MASFTLPALPNATRLEVLQVGAAPLVRRFVELLDLPATLDCHLPRRPGREADLPTSTVLCLLLSNLLLSRKPLYGLSQWAARFVPEYLGVSAQQFALLNDDRCGRACDHLWSADRATLLTGITLTLVRRFGLRMNRFSQDTTNLPCTGEYDGQPAVDAANRPRRLAKGYSKGNPPKFKQLLYNRTISHDGAVPVLCKIHDGNTTDDQVHIDTWNELRQLVGHSNFLYVADSKLCSKDNLAYIAEKQGRFLTIMPKKRKENRRFRERLRSESVDWQDICRKNNPRGKTKPKVVYKGFEDENGSEEGYRILWYHSSLKQVADKQKRDKRLHKACKRLQKLRPRGRGEGFSSEEAALAAAGKVLKQTKTEAWLKVSTVCVEKTKQVQTTAGRPSEKTEYRQDVKRIYQLKVETNQEELRQAEKCDGLFPLISNDKEMSLKDALANYKYQPFSEKRHEQLKSVFGVIPMWLKNPKRIESVLWLYHLVEQIQALIERTLRKRMKEMKVESLALHPEGRKSKAPTTRLLLKGLEGHKRYRVINQVGEVVHTLHDPVSEPVHQALQLLGVDLSAYGLSAFDEG